MLQKLKWMAAGFTVCAVLGTSAVYAAGQSGKIDVVFASLRYMFDGVEKKPTTGQGFIYEGTTYVPLRFVSEALGKDVNWDGKNQTIWVGKKEGEFKYLTELEYARYDGDQIYFDKWPAGDKFSVTTTQYSRGFGTNVYDKSSIEYNLNGKYKKLSGIVGIDDSTKNSPHSGNIIVVGDGKELYRSNDLKGGDLPKSMDVDISGVSKLKIIFDSNASDFSRLSLVFAEARVIE